LLLLCVALALPAHAAPVVGKGGAILLAQAAEPPAGAFVAEDIRIVGLQRFSPGGIFPKLPAQAGDEITPEKTTQIIEALYATGFFRSVDVLREGNVLVIRVEENPTISEVSISGASAIPETALTEMLEEANIAKAKVYDQAAAEEAARAIEAGYVERNHYNAAVEVVVSPLPRNRVAVLFSVDEGDAAKISSIRFVGNEVYSEWRLRREMNLSASGLFGWLSGDSAYSEQKLDADISRLRTFYYESGYLNFDILERSVELSEDKTSIEIVLYVREGGQFVVESIDVALAAGEPDPGFPMSDFRPFITQEVGELYGGQDAGEAVAAMREELGKRGYAEAKVDFAPEVDDEAGKVRIVYQIAPGRVTYVRAINIVGNEFTADEVIRREMLQFERERYSSEKIERSRSRIRRLGYFDSVEIETIPVPDVPGEADLLVRIDEGKTGQFEIGAGVDTDGGVSFNVGLSNNNIFGTGNDFSAKFSRNDDSFSANFNLDERYHTQDGVTRHTGFRFGEEQAAEDSSAYNIDGFSGEYGYVWPFADDGSYRLNLVYRRVNIKNASGLSTLYRRFVDKHGASFNSILLDGGFNYDTRNSASLPSAGQSFALNARFAPPGLELRYYFFDLTHHWYKRLKWFPTSPVLHTRMQWGFGDSYGGGEYPFYHRFLAGGVSSVRGFAKDSIGFAKDASNNALGGQSRVVASAELPIDANFFIFDEQRIFLAPFVDAGAVGENAGVGDLRAAGGLEFRWLSPVGPLRFSYAVPLLEKENDVIDKFQFSVSTF
jgi:outer membrane protein insertion porin family